MDDDDDIEEYVRELAKKAIDATGNSGIVLDPDSLVSSYSKAILKGRSTPKETAIMLSQWFSFSSQEYRSKVFGDWGDSSGTRGAWVHRIVREHPSDAHHSAARAALQDERAPVDDSTMADRLARELWNETELLMIAAGLIYTPFDTDDGHLGVAVGKLTLITTPQVPREVKKPLFEDGILGCDARFARYVESIGQCGREVATAVRTTAAKRFAEWHERHAEWGENPKSRADWLFDLWLDPKCWCCVGFHGKDNQRTVPRFLTLLARVLWRDRLAPAIECEQAPQAKAPRVVVGGDDYVKLPRATSGASWAIGGTGQVVKIDGDDYAEAPSLPLVSRWVPKTGAIMREEDRRLPHQLSFALDREDLPLVVAATSSAQYALTPIAGKLLVWMMASGSAEFARTDLGSLARAIAPGADSIRSRDLERLAEGLKCLETLRLVLPDDTSVRILDIRRPNDPSKAFAEQTIGFAYGPAFADAILTKPTDRRMRKLWGWLLLNLSGAMRLPLDRPTWLRHYVRAGALWNDSRDPKTDRFDRAFLRPYSPEEWGVLTNSMQQGTIDYLQSRDPKLRRKMSDDVRRTREDLDALADLGLIRLEKSGRKALLILPPDPLLEAYSAHRRGARRLHA